MEQDEEPESSPAHEVEIDPDEEARRIILARRARFVAVALVSAGVGTASCGGQTSDGKAAPQPCLSDAAMIGNGGAPQVCLGAPVPVGAGGTGGMPNPCLSGFPSYLTGGSGGMPQPCLEAGLATGGAPIDAGAGGSPQPCLKVAPDAGPDPSDAAADAPREAMPLPCLTPIPYIPNSGNES